MVVTLKKLSLRRQIEDKQLQADEELSQIWMRITSGLERESI